MDGKERRKHGRKRLGEVKEAREGKEGRKENGDTTKERE